MNTKGKKKNIQYGNFEIDEDEFNVENVKVRITTMLDKDVLDSLRSFAKSRDIKYQTALNLILKNFFKQNMRTKNPQNITEQKIRSIVREEIKKRA